MGRLRALLNEAQGVTDLIENAMAQPVLDAGMQLWQGLALIVVVWTGLQMALAGGGLNMAAVARMVLGLSIPLGMLRFYTTALPGTTMTVPDLITGMGRWLHGLIVNDSGEQMLMQIEAAFTAFGNRLGQGIGWRELAGLVVSLWLPGEAQEIQFFGLYFVRKYEPLAEPCDGVIFLPDGAGYWWANRPRVAQTEGGPSAA